MKDGAAKDDLMIITANRIVGGGGQLALINEVLALPDRLLMITKEPDRVRGPLGTSPSNARPNDAIARQSDGATFASMDGLPACPPHPP